MRPVMLVIDDDPASRCHAAQSFALLGWEAVGASSAEWHQACRAHPPSLVLVGLPSVHAATAQIAALRTVPDTADAAIVAWLPSNASVDALAGCDEVLAKHGGPDRLAATAARWRPEDPTETLDRLSSALGGQEVSAMAGRLRDQLRAALATPSPGDDRSAAHRIAGIAGMLGFDALGAAWLAVSDGALGAEAAARIATRRVLAAMRWRCGASPGVSCSAARP